MSVGSECRIQPRQRDPYYPRILGDLQGVRDRREERDRRETIVIISLVKGLLGTLRVVQHFDMALHLQDLLAILRHSEEIVIIHTVEERRERGCESRREKGMFEERTYLLEFVI
jgi:hypothetical protein